MSANVKTTSEKQSESQPESVAVIDIGATAIRMAIAEIASDGEVRVLESLSQAVSIGKDTFTRGVIQRSSIEAAVRVLKHYRQKLAEYQINRPESIRVAATSALREANNRMAFIDRVYIATGFEIDVLDGAEVTRLTYLGVEPHLISSATFSDKQTIVCEVGGGSTEALLVTSGNVEYSTTLRLGSMRLRKMLQTYKAPQLKSREIMENLIDRNIDQLLQEIDSEKPTELITLGGDMRFAVAEILTEWDRNELAEIKIKPFSKLVDEILSLTIDEIVQRYHLSFPEAESIGPALLTYLRFAETLEIKKIYVSNVNLRDGLLEEIAARETWTDQFRNQIIRSTIDLAEKFGVDLEHATYVAEMSKSLFRELADEHQLESRFEVLLYVAALLHEGGLFVSNRAYHKHSMYLIRYSEVFGLGKIEMLTAALIARYHRRSAPQPRHDSYSNLDRELRVSISKLAAILRVSKALDESRSQRISGITCSNVDKQLIISVAGIEDLALEQLALKQTGALFEDVYGLRVLLRRARP